MIGTAPVFDVDTAGFQQAVLEASHHTPILVDFWAEWCGPCRALGPVLERLARESTGAFRLAKVDTDAERDLATANGIRSLPTVRLFVDAAPVAQFMGAQPEAAVRAFLAQHLPDTLPDTLPDGAALSAIDTLLDEARLDEVQAALAVLPATIRESSAARCLALRLDFLREAGTQPAQQLLEARVAANPADLDARYALSLRQAGAGRFADALEGLLLVLSRNRSLHDDGARRSMLQAFEVLGPRDPLVMRYRGLLASTLN